MQPGDPATVAARTVGAGMLLLSGHASYSTAPTGVLMRLSEAQPGALVVTTDSRGRADS